MAQVVLAILAACASNTTLEGRRAFDEYVENAKGVTA